MWERGLKQDLRHALNLHVQSLPMWERGLKLDKSALQLKEGVAPHVGAWIETAPSLGNLGSEASLPMWERGLKHLLNC